MVLMNETELIQKQIRQYLVHSFIYYQLNESVISDDKYDLLCQDLQKDLELTMYPDVPYLDLVRETLDKEGSGYSIKNYPAPIISAAFHLLYQEQYLKLMNFTDFISRYGYRVNFENK